MIKLKQKKILKNILTVILGSTYVFLYYLLLYYLLTFFIDKNIAILISLSIFIVFLIISFTAPSALKTSLSADDDKCPNKDKLLSLFEEVKNEAVVYDKALAKTKCYVYAQSSPISNLTLGSPAASIKGSIYITNNSLGKYDEYELKAIIAHELYHSTSLFVRFIEKVEICCFILKALFYMFLFPFNFFASILKKKKSKKKRLINVVFAFLASIFGLIAFLIRLPYNLLVAPMNIWEENSADDFSIKLGYGDGIKHVFKNNKRGFTKFFEMAFFPIHLSDKARRIRINKLIGYDDKYIDYHFNGDVFNEYCGNSESITIPDFIKVIGNGKSKTINSSVKKITLSSSVINNLAFLNSNIEEVTVLQDISYIGERAFSNCFNLKEVSSFKIKPRENNFSSFENIDENHMYISDNAFSNCPNLNIEGFLLKAEASPFMEIDDGYKFISNLFSSSNKVTKILFIPASVIYCYPLDVDYVITTNKNILSCKGKIVSSKQELISDILNNPLKDLAYFSKKDYEELESILTLDLSYEDITSYYIKYLNILKEMKNSLMTIDGHVHFNNQPYSLETINDFVNVAKQKGIKELYLLDHTHKFLEFKFLYDNITHEESKNWYLKKNPISINEYLDFIKLVRSKDYDVTLHFGLEVCYFKESEQKLKETLDLYNFDFTIGSIHFVNGMGIDLNKDYYEGLDIDKLYQDYYKANIDAVKSKIFTFLGHADLIKLFGFSPSFSLTYIYKELASTLREYNMETENNSGLVRYGFSYPGLNKELLTILKEYGVKIHFSSDAHKAIDIGREFNKMSI